MKKNILAENMRRFGTKNLNEDDNTSYKVTQEQTRLKNIADKLVAKLRSMSEHQVDMLSDEDASYGTIEYNITTKKIVQSKSAFGKNRVRIIKPMINLSINPAKDETGKYVNVDTGKLYVTVYPDTNTTTGVSRLDHRTHDIDTGVGMFGTSEDSIVDEIIKLYDVEQAFSI